MQEYKIKTFPNLGKLKKIPHVQISEHLKLYEGYVKNTNTLISLLKEKIAKQDLEGALFAELVRRLGFEYNGMLLHELYFENLNAKGGNQNSAKKLKKLITQNFSSFDAFKPYFLKVGAMRGIGWVILYQDAKTKQLSVHWINSHEDGHVAGFKPIIVMDVWEHAWSAYLKPTERAKYIEDFWSNIDWTVCEDRLI